MTLLQYGREVALHKKKKTVTRLPRKSLNSGLL
jgi:hypothetical protein